MDKYYINGEKWDVISHRMAIKLNLCLGDGM